MAVWSGYLEDYQMPSFSTFIKVWQENFANLRAPRYNTLGGCDECLQYKSLLIDTPTGSPEWRNVNFQLKSHQNQAKLERTEQRVRDQSSSEFPHLSWTITTDFMQDFPLPWVGNRPKGWFVNEYY